MMLPPSGTTNQGGTSRDLGMPSTPRYYDAIEKMADVKSDGISPLASFEFATAVPLVTGGGTGIGLGLVEEFLKGGCAKVLITGRRESVMQEARSQSWRIPPTAAKMIAVAYARARGDAS